MEFRWENVGSAEAERMKKSFLKFHFDDAKSG